MGPMLATCQNRYGKICSEERRSIDRTRYFSADSQQDYQGNVAEIALPRLRERRKPRRKRL
jgi:hypothetical protein